MKKVEKTVILSVIHHRQSPLESKRQLGYGRLGQCVRNVLRNAWWTVDGERRGLDCKHCPSLLRIHTPQGCWAISAWQKCCDVDPLPCSGVRYSNRRTELLIFISITWNLMVPRHKKFRTSGFYSTTRWLWAGPRYSHARKQKRIRL
jgi:hypothetical protein